MKYESNYYAYNPYNPTTTLKQHGVMGQKWGIWNEETRARYLGGGSKSKWFSKITDRFNKPKETPHLKRTHLIKELSEISDDELNAAIERMKLEEKYLDLLNKYPTASDDGKKYAKKFSNALFNDLSTSLGGAMGRRISKAIDEWIDSDEKNKEEAKKEKYRKEADETPLKDLQTFNMEEAAKDLYVKNKMKLDKK